MRAFLFLALLGISITAKSEIIVGVSVSTTGPGTSLGVPVQNAFGTRRALQISHASS